MTDKELKKLSRIELLELLVRMSESNTQLQEELAKVNRELQMREAELLERGNLTSSTASIAETALQLKIILEETKRSSSEYLESMKRNVEAQQEEAIALIQKEREDLEREKKAFRIAKAKYETEHGIVQESIPEADEKSIDVEENIGKIVIKQIPYVNTEDKAVVSINTVTQVENASVPEIIQNSGENWLFEATVKRKDVDIPVNMPDVSEAVKLIQTTVSTAMHPLKWETKEHENLDVPELFGTRDDNPKKKIVQEPEKAFDKSKDPLLSECSMHEGKQLGNNVLETAENVKSDLIASAEDTAQFETSSSEEINGITGELDSYESTLVSKDSSDFSQKESATIMTDTKAN